MKNNAEDDKYKETFITWNKVAKLYEDIFMDLNIYNETYDLFCELLINDSNSIFEIGCGPGNISKYVLSKNKTIEYFGIDVSVKMIELAKANNPMATFKVMDTRNINHLSTKFNAVICGFTIPYLSNNDLCQLILDCKNCLNSKGLFYLSFVEGSYEKSSYISGSNGDRMFFYYHSIETILNELNKRGFDILHNLKVDYVRGDKNEIHTVLIAQLN